MPCAPALAGGVILLTMEERSTGCSPRFTCEFCDATDGLRLVLGWWIPKRRPCVAGNRPELRAESAELTCTSPLIAGGIMLVAAAQADFEFFEAYKIAPNPTCLVWRRTSV